MPDVRREIRFRLNEDDIVLRDIRPDETLLDYLRLRRSLTGTKEGCAEGDCGACTVLVGRLTERDLVYEAVNACIRFLGSLDCTHVVTIEDLRSPDGLHSVQAAMVDFHGSQCGFCTPGIVMALYALWMRTPRMKTADIEKALQGNLCRCTGYESIMRAARAVSEQGKIQRDYLIRERGEVESRLRAMMDGRRIEIGEGKGRLVVPADVDDLADILEAGPEATIVSGATDIGLWVTKQMRDIAPVVFIGNLADLRSFVEADGVIRMGAALTYTETYALLGDRIPAFRALLDRVGGDQVRNMGTIGGNIANGSPIGDMPPPLIALDARLTLRKGRETRTLRLEDYFIAYGKQDRRPGEFVVAIEVPLPASNAQFAVYKISKRRDEDITSVLGAFHLRLSDENRVETIRIAYGGMAATPKRAAAAEAALTGQPWTEKMLDVASRALARDFTPLTDMRASADYRALVARNLLKRFFLETQGKSRPLQVMREGTG